MRHIYYHRREGTAEYYDGRIACTHVLLGQRNEAHYRPAHMDKKDNLTPDEKVAKLRHQREVVRGRFAKCVLEWCESAEEAEALKARFKEPEFINLSVDVVSDQIGYG